MIQAFLYGVILAFGLIIPLGVQNIFVFNQGATQQHFLHAMPSVLAASFCDTLLILCSVLGVSVVVLTIPWLKTVIFVVGFVFLVYMGWVTWKSKAKITQGEKPLSAKKQVAFAVSVSLLNPHALMDTIGVIGTNSLSFVGMQRWVFTFACILVSWLWFLGLSVAGHFFHKFDQTRSKIVFINKLSALIIWTVACYILWQLLSQL